MTQQNSVQMDSELAKYVAELEKRVRNLEDKFDSGKEVLTLQEAAQYMGIARSSLYKMTSNQTIPFYRPNGKLIFFEKDDILSWIRRNRVFSTEEIEEEARLHMQRLSMKNKKD
ncbi:MAG: helix-turn-helix domain-containing protein [Bacteroidales bacterium]|jgi:excisionase family DNA binding protein|nr:helix-turn-helix domain-containing protein [Bacteroidales bacterium]